MGGHKICEMGTETECIISHSARITRDHHKEPRVIDLRLGGHKICEMGTGREYNEILGRLFTQTCLICSPATYFTIFKRNSSVSLLLASVTHLGTHTTPYQDILNIWY